VYTFASSQTFAGGFDLGLVQAGYQFVHKVEQAGGFGMANCEANRHLLGDTWTSQIGDYQAWYAPTGVEVLAGNPPCS
jgi:hypothetical protein